MNSMGFVLAGLMVGLATAPANAETFGSWHTDTASTDVYAATVNDSGHVFGQYCYPREGSCLWMFSMGTACDRNDRYPALINSDAGALPVEIYCMGPLPKSPGRYLYAFTEFDKMTELAVKASRIGVAVPLKSDQFRVVRFDMDGAREAILAMRAAASRKTTPAGRGTYDEKL
jgi:hypothetical protein